MNQRQEDEWRDLKMRLLTIGLRPEQIPAIIDQMEGNRRGYTEEEIAFAPEISEADMAEITEENYVPMSVESAEAVIADLRRLGVHVS